MFAASDVSLTNEPTYPWSLPTVGLPALLLVTVVLVVLTVWIYRGVSGTSFRRVTTVLALRLAALLMAILALLRPSLAFQDDQKVPSFLLIAADGSESMTIQDEFDGLSRWNALLRTLKENEPLLRKLRDEKNVTIVLSRFAADVREFDPQARADGKRTDFGEMLHALFEKYRGERYLRGLLVLSDGADNGTRFPALAEASQWRTLPCPIHTFALGKTTTTEKQSDVGITAVNVEPSPVPVKGELTVKITVDAPGFESRPVDFQLLLDDKEVAVERVVVNEEKVPADQKPRLPLTTGNDVRLRTTAPTEAKEVKLTVRIKPQNGEVTEANNEISTYVTIAKEGLSVLFVDKARFPEPQLICDALRRDPTIRLHVAWLRRDEALPAEQPDLFQFDKQHYDVILVGDVTARQLSGGNPAVLETIRKLVFEKATGFLMMGGQFTFGNRDWHDTPIADLLPVELNISGQVDASVRMEPTEVGLRRYVMKLAEKPEDNARVWKELPPFKQGVSRLGKAKQLATVYANSDKGEPILVGLENYGAGRTLAFAGDTTHYWRRTPEGIAHHERFWKQIVLWLAHQEERKGNVIVKPDTRRLAAGGKLGFSVDLRGKGDTEANEKHFDVKVVNPQGVEVPVLTARDKTDERGTFWKTDGPGEYRLVVRGWGKDVEGNPIPDETATARFLVYQDEAETMRRAADHDFLKKLATAGGGTFQRADELARFLQELQTQPLPQGRPKAELWPDWRRNALSGFLIGFFLAFVALLAIEWFLRRRWGLV